MPAPYEVMFYGEMEDSPAVMLWRYPEPRVLTYVRITPVPFNTTEDPDISTADLSELLQVRATQAQAKVHAHTHTCTHIHTHICTHTHKHTHMDMQAGRHAHT